MQKNKIKFIEIGSDFLDCYHVYTKLYFVISVPDTPAIKNSSYKKKKLQLIILAVVGFF